MSREISFTPTSNIFIERTNGEQSTISISIEDSDTADFKMPFNPSDDIRKISVSGVTTDKTLQILNNILSTSSPVEELNLTSCVLGGNKGDRLSTLVDIISQRGEDLNLTKLNLNSTRVSTEEDVAAVCRLIDNKPSIKDLDLSDNNIGNTGIQAIAGVLGNLQRLDLTNTRFGYDSLVALTEALKENSSLLSLIINENNLCETDGANNLANAIRENHQLQELRIEDPELGQEGLNIILNAIRENNSIVRIDFGYNTVFTPDTINNLINIIENKDIEYLRFSGACDDEFAAKLSDQIKENSSLKEICIYNTEITNAGASKLAEAINENSSLESLIILGSSMNHEGANEILDSLKNNTNISQIMLSGIDFEDLVNWQRAGEEDSAAAGAGGASTLEDIAQAGESANPSISEEVAQVEDRPSYDQDVALAGIGNSFEDNQDFSDSL